MYDSPDPSKRHMIGWICDDKKCVWTNPAFDVNSKTPIIDSLLRSRPTSFPLGISKKRKHRDPDEIESLTKIFGGV